MRVPLIAAGAALLLAGCGSSSHPAVQSSKMQAGVRFSECMRSHGVPNFPDPGADRMLSLDGLNPDAPSFQAAQTQCGRLMPGGNTPPPMTASERHRALVFAQCVRRHGLPDFPDPGAGRGGHQPAISLRGIEFQLSPGVNPRSPAFKQAAAACGIKPP